MSAIKDGRYPVTLDKDRYIVFNLNVLDEMDDKMGGYEKLPEFIGEENPARFKNLRWLLALLLNEGADDGDEPMTEKQVGKLLTLERIKTLTGSIYKAFAKGVNGDNPVESEQSGDSSESSDDGTEKNLTGGPVS